MMPSFAAAGKSAGAASVSTQKGGSRLPSQQELRWAVDCCWRLCGEGEEIRFYGKARLLDRRQVSSVAEAVEGLNANRLLCSEDLCVMSVAAERAYYVLFRRGKRDAALARFQAPALAAPPAAAPSRAWGHDAVKVQPPALHLGAVPTPARGHLQPKSYAPQGESSQASPASSPPAPSPSAVKSLQPPLAARSGRSREQLATLPQPTVVATVQSPVARPRELRDLEQVRYSELQLMQCLGSGEFGKVSQGFYKGEEVAVKELFWNNSTGQWPHLIKELQKEIDSFRHLRHPNLVRFIAACFETPHLCLVTEYMPGGSLHTLLHVNRTQLTLLQASEMCLQIADAVQYLHSQRPIVVHRDLKSLNVVLDHQLNIKICDFGLTEPMLRTHITKKNNGGSPRYMAPELFDSKAKVTEKIDVWAMGCIFVEICGGPLPYSTITTLVELTKEILARRRSPSVPETVFAEIKPIINQCLVFDSWLRRSSREVYNYLRENRMKLGDKQDATRTGIPRSL